LAVFDEVSEDADSGVGDDSDLALSAVAVPDSTLESAFFDESLDPLALAVVDELALRLSLMYQPLPLNTTPTGWKTRRMGCPQSGQIVSGSSENL
jgi:hypothetical protein